MRPRIETKCNFDHIHPRPIPRATHMVVTARTDTNMAADSLRLCTECAKTYAGGSIEVANGPQIITVVRLR